MDHEKVQNTGTIFPRLCDLRRRTQRKYLFLKTEVSGRVFTEQVCRMITRKIIKSLPYRLPVDPTTTLEKHVEAQALRLQKLARRCKRMDTVETQCWVQPQV